MGRRIALFMKMPTGRAFPTVRENFGSAPPSNRFAGAQLNSSLCSVS
jgi:hypothetical protein